MTRCTALLLSFNLSQAPAHLPWHAGSYCWLSTSRTKTTSLLAMPVTGWQQIDDQRRMLVCVCVCVCVWWLQGGGLGGSRAGGSTWAGDGHEALVIRGREPEEAQRAGWRPQLACHYRRAEPSQAELIPGGRLSFSQLCRLPLDVLSLSSAQSQPQTPGGLPTPSPFPP